MNLFEQAIKRNELAKFILGNGEYFVADREYGGHWPLGSFNLYIKSYLSNNGELFDNEVWSNLVKILDENTDNNMILDYIIGFLIPYYYPENSEIVIKRAIHTPNYFIEKLSKTISSRKEQLLNDKRGTGIEWDSKEGLWGSILSNLIIVHQRGGPNFLPYLSVV